MLYKNNTFGIDLSRQFRLNVLNIYYNYIITRGRFIVKHYFTQKSCRLLAGNSFYLPPGYYPMPRIVA